MTGRLLLLVALLFVAPLCAAADRTSVADTLATEHGPVVVRPFGHASLALVWQEAVILVDPVDGAERFAGLPRPQLILVTHRHGDHFDADTVRGLAGEHTVVVTPQDVSESIPANDVVTLAHGESVAAQGVVVTAVPAYNRTEGRLDFHPRGRDNGYVLDFDGFRVYISGDTEDVPEMAELGDIDAAFLCMNLPWTMSLAQAVRAARMISPRVLYPYHFRNGDGTMTDLEGLQRELAADEVIEVRVLDWY